MNGKFKSFIKYFLLFTFSGYIYVCIELIFRGHSDITMMFAGSICAIPMIVLNNYFTYDIDFLLQLFLCVIFCTIVEFIFGIIFNQNYTIWDYRNMPFNLYGQICLPFSFLWMGIAACIIPLMDWIDCYIFGYKPETKPYYKIFGKVIWRMK